MDTTQDSFLKQFLAAQPSVYAFIRGNGFPVPDADDLLQEVALVLWRQYSSYDPTRPFLGWAIGIARNIARNRWRHSKVRQDVVVDTDLCGEVGDLVADALTENEGEFARERDHLEDCLNALPEHSRKLITLRYADDADVRKVAKAVGKTYAATSVMLSRIRAVLEECITSKLAGARS